MDVYALKPTCGGVRCYDSRVSAIRTAQQGGTFVVHASVGAADAMAPAVVRAVMLAVRPMAIADREAEVATVPDSELTQWRREPGPLPRG
jgi:hypothetical protein